MAAPEQLNKPAGLKRAGYLICGCRERLALGFLHFMQYRLEVAEESVRQGDAPVLLPVG
jgi:hypothetical protein